MSGQEDFASLVTPADGRTGNGGVSKTLSDLGHLVPLTGEEYCAPPGNTQAISQTPDRCIMAAVWRCVSGKAKRWGKC